MIFLGLYCLLIIKPMQYFGRLRYLLWDWSLSVGVTSQFLADMREQYTVKSLMTNPHATLPLKHKQQK